MDSLLNTAPCGFLSFTDDGCIAQINATLLEWLGQEADAVQGQHIESLLPLAGRIFYQTHFFPLLKMHGNVIEMYFALRTRNGEELPMLVNAVRREQDSHVVNDCVFLVIRQRNQYEDELIYARKAAEEAVQARDLALGALDLAHCALEAKQGELQRLNAHLEILATTDGLTGLKNRRVFQERLTEEYQRNRRYKTVFSLVLLDVDHFKQFNDTFGHPAGDEVLRRVAAILQAVARVTDLAARYGGEEFVLLLPETDVQGAITTAERIRKALAEAIWDRRTITVSVGVATLNQAIESAAHLLEAADRALYQSKTLGRNRVTHLAAMKSR